MIQEISLHRSAATARALKSPAGNLRNRLNDMPVHAFMYGSGVQLWGTFSGGLGVGVGAGVGAGLGGVGSHRDFAGPRCSLAFFGFFGSRPRLSRLPITPSLNVDVMWPPRILQNALARPIIRTIISIRKAHFPRGRLLTSLAGGLRKRPRLGGAGRLKILSPDPAWKTNTPSKRP